MKEDVEIRRHCAFSLEVQLYLRKQKVKERDSRRCKLHIPTPPIVNTIQPQRYSRIQQSLP